MENNTRRLALQQMLLFTVGSSFFLGSCKTTSTKSTAAISRQPLKPVHVLVGDTVTELHAGDYHLRPHGIVHTFWNSGDVPARFIDMYPNQDFISFFEEFVRIEKRLQKKGLTMQSPERWS